MNLLSGHHFSPGLDVLSVFCPSPEPAEEEGEFGINAMRGRLRLHCLNIEFKILSGLVVWEGLHWQRLSKSWRCQEEGGAREVIHGVEFLPGHIIASKLPPKIDNSFGWRKNVGCSPTVTLGMSF